MDVENFVSSIKDKYRERLVNREKQWPPCHSSKLVTLVLVKQEKGESYSANQQRDEDKAKRIPLPYGELFRTKSGEKPVRKVLVEGDAGIGKTTLCISASEDWASGKLFQQFELLLLLPLRHKKVVSVSSLIDLLKLLHSSQKKCAFVADYLEENEGNKVLIIADGWDELKESDRQEGSFMYELLFGDVLPFVSMVLTSRPYASAPLHQLSQIDRFVEVCGFSKDNIKEYIQSEFIGEQKKADTLLEQLEDNPLVESVCSIPLNCTIICHLWRTLEEALPTTMTELYTKIILNVILRNIQKNTEFSAIRNLPSFDALPVDLQQAWSLLCEFAYHALANHQIVFSEEVIAEFFPQGVLCDKVVHCFGLLQFAEAILETGCGLSFHFLHLTFQEYLAALYLVKQPAVKQLEALRSKISTMTLRFFFGIYFHQSQIRSPIIDVKALIQVACDRVLKCHCAFEAENELINNHTVQFLKNFNNVLHFGFPRNAHDCAAVLHVITNIQEFYSMKVNFCDCGIRENQIRTLTDILASKQGMLQVKELNLWGNNLSDDCLNDLFQRASVAFESLSSLHLRGNKIESEGIKSIVMKLPFTELSTLDLSHNPIGESIMQLIVKDHVQLQYLNLEGTLTGDNDTNGVLISTCIHNLLSHCPRLRCLNLSLNKLGIPGASALGKSISQYKQEFYWIIRMNNCSLGDEGLIAFLDNLEGPCYLKCLELMDNNIRSSGISYLADSVCSGNNIFKNRYIKLYLDGNSLGVEGTLAIGRMLSCKYCLLPEVSLSRCELTRTRDEIQDVYYPTSMTLSDIGKQLCQMPRISTVSSLNLTGNNFNGEAICILTGFMHLCPHLTSLSCKNCGITSDDLQELFRQQTELKLPSQSLCSRLDSWYLEDNFINDRGIIAIIRHMSSLFPSLACSSMGVISLDGDQISTEMARKLNEVIQQRKKVNVVMPLISPFSISLKFIHISL